MSTTITLLLVCVLGAALVLPALGETACQQLIIPGYFYPSLADPDNEWNIVAGLPKGGIIIMNPNSGPGSSVNSDYTTAVANVKANGFTVLGYVHTSYGARAAADVKADVNLYQSFYDIDGIFYDESSTGSSDLSYYTDIADYVHAIDTDYTVMLNFGVTPDEGYMDIADIAMTFEQTFTYYNESYVAPSYVEDYAATKFAHLVHATSATDWEQALAWSFERNAGYIYITDDTLPNPWDTLPPYIANQSIFSGENCGNCNTAAVEGALQWLRGQQTASGFMTSFDAPGSATWAANTAYAYDQAVASISLLLNAPNISSSDLSVVRNILSAISENLVPDSDDNSLLQVPFSWKTDTLVSSSPYRSGTAAWVAEAFALYQLLTGDDSYLTVLAGIAKWLQSMLAASGSNNCVVGGPDVSWCSTEHNIDSFFALHVTAFLTSDSTFDDSASTIAATLGSSLWNSAQERFKQGVDDDYRALDCQSWGSIWLMSDHEQSIDSNARVTSALSFAESTFWNHQISDISGEIVGGYGPYADASNSFQANCVWSEGTMGVALAYLRAGQTAKTRQLVHQMGAITTNDGSLLYAATETIVDNAGDVFYPYPSVAGTGWLALVCAPKQEVFWAMSSDIYTANENFLGTSTPTSQPSTSTRSVLTSAVPTYVKSIAKSLRTTAAVAKFEKSRGKKFKVISYPQSSGSPSTSSNAPAPKKTGRKKRRA